MGPRRLAIVAAAVAGLAAAAPVAPTRALGFAELSSYRFRIVDRGTDATPDEIAAAQKLDQIPAAIRGLDGRRVAVTGFLMPLELEGGKAKKFFLMKNVNTCCYGSAPNMNDFAIVTMTGAGVKAVQDIPVVVIGTLHVREKYADGYVVSLYEIDGEDVKLP